MKKFAAVLLCIVLSVCSLPFACICEVEPLKETQSESVLSMVRDCVEAKENMKVFLQRYTKLKDVQIADYISRLTELMEERSLLEAQLAAKAMSPDEMESNRNTIPIMTGFMDLVDTMIEMTGSVMAKEEKEEKISQYTEMYQAELGLLCLLDAYDDASLSVSALTKEYEAVGAKISDTALEIANRNGSSIGQSELDTFMEYIGEAGNASLFLKEALKNCGFSESEILEIMSNLPALQKKPVNEWGYTRVVAKESKKENQENGKKETSKLLYEDDNLSITYSDFYLEKIGSNYYLKTELLFTNKTDSIIEVVCDSIIVNGCAVSISKFVNIPAKSKYLNEWTNSADLYLKYGIDEVETFSMVFDYAGKGVASKRDIQTAAIQVK